MPSKAGDLLRDASPLHRLPARDVAVHEPSHQDTDRASQASSMSVAPCERPVEVSSFLLGSGEWTVDILDEPMRGRRAPINLARFSAQRHSVQDTEDIASEYQDLWFGPAPASQNNSPPFIVCLAVTFLDVITHWLMALCNGLKARVNRNYPPVIDPRARVRPYSEPPMHQRRIYDSEDQESDYDAAVAGKHIRSAASDTRKTWEDKNKANEVPVDDSALETHGFEIQHGTRRVNEVVQSVGNSSGSSMHMATSSSSLRRNAAGASPTSSRTPELSASGRQTRGMAKKGKETEAGQPGIGPDA